MKVGKEEIAGLVAAVRRFVDLDHAELSRQWYAVCHQWATALAAVPGVRTVVEDTNSSGQPVPRVRVFVDPAIVGRSSGVLVDALQKGDPGVIVLPGSDESFYLGADLLEPGQSDVVLTRVLAELQEGL
jgi:L-seryl-tRNA(Ser) seleniumtransferase